MANRCSVNFNTSRPFMLQQVHFSNPMVPSDAKAGTNNYYWKLTVSSPIPPQGKCSILLPYMEVKSET